MQDRTRINEVYAQGATNQMIVPFADNADPQNPAIMRVYIPDTMARINKCILNYQLEAFRAYSKAIAGGGGTVASTSAGGATTQSSSSGGGVAVTSGSGGGDQRTTASGGGSAETTYEYIYMSGTSGDNTYSAEGHAHGLPMHGHKIEIPNHRHDFTIRDHRHDIDIPNHTHSVSIPNHQHNVTIPDHIHELEFGIYRGSTANKVTIKIDGKPIPQTQPGQDIDIVKYLSVDGGGKIRRNTWHTIEIIPDKMTRIAANVFMQIFTNSRGGGDY